jgi:hypothetical membrane protein
MATAELFDRLSWLLIVPLGVVQVTAAIWVGRQVGTSIVGRVLLATLAALAVALVGAMFFEEGPLRVLMLLIYFVPGVPTLALLGRKKMWGPALLLFLIPPAPFVPPATLARC